MNETMGRASWIATAAVMAILTASVSPNTTAAYPISPVPLRLLCERSDLIVIARVAGERPVTNEDGWNSTLADLSVLETLKGPPAEATLSIPYSAGMICPAPPSYPVGKTLIVFLSRSDEDGTLHTLSLSYGTKQLPDETRVVFAQRIREWVEISREPDSNRRLERTTEWLVQMAEDPVTRWEAVYDFEDHMRPPEAFFGRREPSVDYWSRIDASQRARLFDLVLEPGPATYAWWQLVDLFEETSDERLLPAVVARLRAVTGKTPYFAWSAMRLVAERLGDERLKTWLKEQSRSDIQLVFPAFMAQVGHLGGVPAR
jgi:hypothetical protein